MLQNMSVVEQRPILLLLCKNLKRALYNVRYFDGASVLQLLTGITY